MEMRMERRWMNENRSWKTREMKMTRLYCMSEARTVIEVQDLLRQEWEAYGSNLLIDIVNPE